MKFENRQFKNEEVAVDGNQFVDCDIRNCKVQFNGGEWSFDRMTWGQPIQFAFGGPAKSTIMFLRLIYSMKPDGPAMIEAILNQGGLPPAKRMIP